MPGLTQMMFSLILYTLPDLNELEKAADELYYHNPMCRIPILFTIHMTKPYFHEKELEVKVRAHG